MNNVATESFARERSFGPTWRGWQFFLVMIAATTASFSRFAVNPIQESLRVALSFSDNQMALLQGPALALPMVLAAMPLGFFIDRYSRARLLIFFAAVDVLGSALTSWAPNFATLFVVRCIVGLAVTAISTTAFSLIADLCAPPTRGRATMLVVIGQYAGMAAAFALGGALLSPSGVAAGDWRHTMLYLTAPILLAFFVNMALREPPRTEAAIQNPSVRDTFLELRRYRFVIAPLVGGLVMAEVATLAGMTWAAPAFARSFGLTSDRIGAIMAMALILSGTCGPLLGGFLADTCQRKGGPRSTIVAVATATLVCMPLGCFAISPSVSFACVLLTVFMTVISGTLVTGIALFTIVIPNELRGVCMALLAAAQVLIGVGVGPLAVSSLASVLGGPTHLSPALAVVEVVASGLAALCYWHGRGNFSSAGA